MGKEGQPRTLDEVFEYTGIIDQVSPTRSVAWSQQSLSAEAEEARFEDPDYNMEAFKSEMADVYISWALTLRMAGIPLEDAVQMVFEKVNVVYDRATRVNEMGANGKTWDENYRMVKRRENLDVIK